MHFHLPLKKGVDLHLNKLDYCTRHPRKLCAKCEMGPMALKIHTGKWTDRRGTTGVQKSSLELNTRESNDSSIEYSFSK